MSLSYSPQHVHYVTYVAKVFADGKLKDLEWRFSVILVVSIEEGRGTSDRRSDAGRSHSGAVMTE